MARYSCSYRRYLVRILNSPLLYHCNKFDQLHYGHYMSIGSRCEMCESDLQIKDVMLKLLADVVIKRDLRFSRKCHLKITVKNWPLKNANLPIKCFNLPCRFSRKIFRIGRSKGKPRMRAPSQSNFFHFHEFF